VFDEKITLKSVRRLMGNLDGLFTAGADQVDLYFTTTGGSGDYSYVLIDYLNKNKDKITLIVFGHIYSAGGWIVKYVQCKKEFLKEITLMIHTANIVNGDFKDVKREHESSTWAVSEHNKQTNESFLAEIKEHLTKEEIELYSNDKDVYIVDQERIKKLLS